MRRIDAEELEPYMAVYDEYAATTFMVTNVRVNEHSVNVHGRKLVPSIGTEPGAALVDHATLYVIGDSGLFLLAD